MSEEKRRGEKREGAACRGGTRGEAGKERWNKGRRKGRREDTLEDHRYLEDEMSVK